MHDNKRSHLAMENKFNRFEVAFRAVIVFREEEKAKSDGFGFFLGIVFRPTRLEVAFATNVEQERNDEKRGRFVYSIPFAMFHDNLI